jgi:hypothetical protein
MKLLSCIEDGSSRIVDFDVGAGDREVGGAGRIKGEVGDAIGSKVLLYLLCLTRDGLGELGEPGCHTLQRFQGDSRARHVVHWEAVRHKAELDLEIQDPSIWERCAYILCCKRSYEARQNTVGSSMLLWRLVLIRTAALH